MVLKRMPASFFLFALFCLFFAPLIAGADPQHGLAMIGQPQLPRDFSHLPYTNAQAPKGGKLTFGVVGTFDGVNPFVIKNFRTTARGLFADGQFGSLVYETLMRRSYDEPFTLYGLVAEEVEINDERTQMTFSLRREARFSDNVQIMPEDVLFSHQLLRDHGRPPYSSYMGRVEKVEKLDERRVRFQLDSGGSRELALLIASSMPILPRHKIDVAQFEENGLEPILGSGPYEIEKIEAGRRIVYRRNPDYWGAHLPLNRGLYNFDQIQIDYYRNDNARFEAFKKGLIDVFVEENPTRWRQGYDFIGMREGRVIREEFATGLPAPMIGFVFNTRRKLFHDKRVREALSLLVDFDWINRNLYHDAYQRTQGFWDGSELSSLPPPMGEIESKPGFDREKAALALELLQQAGFKRDGNKLFTPEGQVFRFEMLITRLEDEKLALAFSRSLARLGIEISVRQVDDSQYQNRLGSFDYDMIVGRLSASPSPGTEQRNRWSSQAADAKGSFNFAGVKEAAVDALIEELLAASTQSEFVARVRALDRALISGHYYIPLYHVPHQWVVRWAHIGRPSRPSLYGYRLPAWWRHP